MTLSVKSPQAFQALVKQDPKAAQAWLKEVAAHADNALSTEQLGAVNEALALKTDAFAKAPLPLDALFGTAAVAPVGDPALDLPVIHGKLTVDRGAKVQAGEQGYREWPDLKMTLTTDDGRKFSLESDHDNRTDIF